MSKPIDMYSRLSIDDDQRKTMRKKGLKILPGHYVNCFYVKPLRVNVIANNVRHVTRHYMVQSWEVSKTVCTVSMLNDDLLGTGIKSFAYSDEKNYNKVKELHYETT